MIELTRHIENLLFTNDCVIVPGLGGFVTHYVTAHYEAAEKVFYPPCRHVGFNPQLQMNDGLLVQSYMQAHDSSYPEAMMQIERDVEALKAELQAQGSCKLEGIGTLTMDLSGRYGFKPQAEGIVSPGLYGMEPLPVSEVGRRAKQPASAPTEKAAEHAKRQYTFTVSRRVVDMCSAASVALLIYFGWSGDLGNNTAPEAQQASVTSGFVFLSDATRPHPVRPAACPDSIRPTDTTMTAAGLTQSAPAAMSPEMGATSAEKPATNSEMRAPQAEAPRTKAEARADKPYGIVLASAITESNAERFVAQLEAEGLKGAYVYRRRHMVRVIYNHYATEAEARAQLSELRSRHNAFAEAWVMAAR